MRRNHIISHKITEYYEFKRNSSRPINLRTIYIDSNMSEDELYLAKCDFKFNENISSRSAAMNWVNPQLFSGFPGDFLKIDNILSYKFNSVQLRLLIIKILMNFPARERVITIDQIMNNISDGPEISEANREIRVKFWSSKAEEDHIDKMTERIKTWNNYPETKIKRFVGNESDPFSIYEHFVNTIEIYFKEAMVHTCFIISLPKEVRRSYINKISFFFLNNFN